MRHGAADSGVGVEDDVAGGVVDQPDRQRHDQLAAAGLGQLPAAQPGLDEMELSLAELAFHTEQEPVVKVARVVEAVFVADQRAGHPAQFQELVPVGGVSGQAGAFQAEHDPGPAEGHFGDQLLESFPVGGGGAGLALVDVDHGDLAGGPAQRDRLAAQVVLADRGLGVVEDLLEAGLADVQKRRPGKVGGGHLGRRGAGEHALLLVVAVRGPGGYQVPVSVRAARMLMSSMARCAGTAGAQLAGRPAGDAGCGGGRGEACQGVPPCGDALAGQHAEAERERSSACVQGGVTQLLVAGVQPAAGSGVLAGIRAVARFSSRGAR